MTATLPKARECQHMLRTRYFRAEEVDLIDVIQTLLRGERFTGKVTVNFSLGKPITIEAEQRTRVSAS